MTLDAQVSRAVLAVRLLEDLVHRPEGWTMQWGPHEVPVEREVTQESVMLRASFPDVCHLARVSDPLVLKHDGVVRSVRSDTHPGDGGFAVEWVVSARTDVLAG